MLQLREERMADHFVKHHIDGLPCAAVLHKFSRPDHGPAHDHPWPFFSFIVHGGYVEEVFDRETGSSHQVHRAVGQSFYIPATHIHRIVDLPFGECHTLILPGPHEQKSGFWEFRGDGAYHRFWDEPEFKRLGELAGRVSLQD